MRRIPLIAAPVLAVVLAAAGCNANDTSDANAETPTQVEKGGTLYLLSSDSAANFDPATSFEYAGGPIHLFHRSLTTWKITPDAQPEVIPDLATDTGTPSDGGKTWTYTLKDGLTYSNGDPITAQDVKYGLERTFDPALAGGLGYHKTLLVGAADYPGPFKGDELASIEVPDDKTIVFHLTTAFGDWPWIASMPAFAPVPEAADTKPAKYGENPVSSGPYMIESFDQGKEVVGVRNPEWSNDDVRKALPDRVVLELGLSESTIVNRLIGDSGDDQTAFTYANVPASSLSQVQNDPAVEARMGTGSGTLMYLAMNVQSPNLSDVRVRQAINYAIDKSAVQLAAGGSTIGGEIATTIIPPGIPGYEDYNLYAEDPAGDQEQAEDLLAEAGADGLELTMLVDGSSELAVAESGAVQASLKEVGIDVRLKQMDGEAWYYAATGEEGDFDMTLTYWIADWPSGASAIQPIFGADQMANGLFNMSRYTTPEVQAAIDAALSETDHDAATADWAALDQQIMEDAPIVPLLYTTNAMMHGSKVANYYVPDYMPYPNLLDLGVAQ